MKDDWKFITTESGERSAIDTDFSIPAKPESLVMHLDFSK